MKLRSSLENYLFVLPAVAMFATFGVYPFLKVFQLSVYEWDGIRPQMTFVGLANFWDVFVHNKIWWRSIWNAAYITLLALTFQNVLALLLALACDRGIRGGQIYRVIFYLPPVLSGIVVGLIWSWIYDGNYGLLNHWLKVIGLEGLTRSWLSEPQTALTSVAIIHMWKGFGWGFVIFLAGLQNIPRELYEAARVDGANAWQIFKEVTIPMMIPVFVLVAILTILGTMQIFDIIISTTGGGPGYHTEVPVTRIYATMVGGQFGYACAEGIVFGVLLLLVSLVQMKIGKSFRQAP